MASCDRSEPASIRQVPSPPLHSLHVRGKTCSSWSSRAPQPHLEIKRTHHSRDVGGIPEPVRGIPHLGICISRVHPPDHLEIWTVLDACSTDCPVERFLINGVSLRELPCAGPVVHWSFLLAALRCIFGSFARFLFFCDTCMCQVQFLSFQCKTSNRDVRLAFVPGSADSESLCSYSYRLTTWAKPAPSVSAVGDFVLLGDAAIVLCEKNSCRRKH